MKKNEFVLHWVSWLSFQLKTKQKELAQSQQYFTSCCHLQQEHKELDVNWEFWLLLRISLKYTRLPRLKETNHNTYKISNLIHSKKFLSSNQNPQTSLLEKQTLLT